MKNHHDLKKKIFHTKNWYIQLFSERYYFTSDCQKFTTYLVADWLFINVARMQGNVDSKAGGVDMMPTLI